MDERIHRLERAWSQNIYDEEALLRYVTALYQSGNYLMTFYLLGEHDPDKIKHFLVEYPTGKGFPSLLPKDWRKRRGLEPRSPRFEVELNDEGIYQLADWAYAIFFGEYDTRAEARRDLRHVKEYTKIYGDIDFNAMPYGPDEPLNYNEPEMQAKWWLYDYPGKD